jgi:hypothetical protein
MDDHSITAQKQAFIRTVVRSLDTPLTPSANFKSTTSNKTTNLPPKTISDIIDKVNNKIRSHNRLLFSTQSQRHVAEQIESLYWNNADKVLEEGEVAGVNVRWDADLTASDIIRDLPVDLQDLRFREGHERSDEEGERYARVRQELIDLSTKRDKLKNRLARYRDMEKLTEPLGNAKENVQPNLVTRDGELGRELERMRVLLARVSGRVPANSEQGEKT